MQFLINIFKKAKKGDGFRAPETPTKYNDVIMQLNSVGADQYRRMDTSTINRVSKSTMQLTQTTAGGSTLPSS